MHKRLSTILIIIFLIISPLYSIGFGYHVIKVRTNSDFSAGVFPTSLLYQFDFPIPDFIKGNKSELIFRIDNGIDFRTLRQDPITGIPFASAPDSEDYAYPKDYIAVFNEMNLGFGQGILKTSFANKDLLKFWGSFDIRFENAYERFSYLLNSDNTESLFKKSSITNEERFNTWIGQPELAGDRSTINTSISLGLDINLMSSNITTRNGLKNTFGIRLNPSWMDLFKDETYNFIAIWNKLDLAFTPLAIKMQGERDTTWFSIVLDNSTTYRYLTGPKIPYYIQDGEIYGAKALNTNHIITNRTSLTLYGPQINSYDCYPYISGFIDLGLSFGNLLNSENQKYVDGIASIGLKAEFIVFNIASFYFEIGKVLDQTLNDKPETLYKIGFTFGV